MNVDHLVLGDRGVVSVAGDEGRSLLQRLLTNDVETLTAGQARYAALLTPQGKVVSDFLVVAASDAELLLDVPLTLAGDLVKKLTLYRLRAKVTLADRSADLAVVAWRDTKPADALLTYTDPRHPNLWGRAILPRAGLPEVTEEPATRLAYMAARIAAGVPEGGIDFAYGDTFPHEANLDHLHGVDFKKGCYVGQEVVSRVHHRGTARKRVVTATFDGDAPPPGTELLSGGLAIGTMGSSAAGVGLATVRLDRLKEATEPVTAGAKPISLDLPAWA